MKENGADSENDGEEHPTTIHPIIEFNVLESNYTVSMKELKFEGILKFPEALALFLSIYATFNVQFVPNACHTVQFLERSICKIPIVESQHAFHSKRKIGKNLLAVLNAESAFYSNEPDPSEDLTAKRKLLLFFF